MNIFILLPSLVIFICDATKRALETTERTNDDTVIDSFKALRFNEIPQRGSSDERPRKKMRTLESPPATGIPAEVPSTMDDAEEGSETESSSLDQSVSTEDSGSTDAMEDEDTWDDTPPVQAKRRRSEDDFNERPMKKPRTEPSAIDNRYPKEQSLKRTKIDEKEATIQRSKRFRDEGGHFAKFEFDHENQEDELKEKEGAVVDRSDENSPWQLKHERFSKFRKAMGSMTGRWPPFTFKNAFYFEASPIFNQKNLIYLDPAKLTVTNSQNILRTMCYLDPNNPFMKISQPDLLNQAAADPQLTAELTLAMFADGLGHILADRERQMLHVPGFRIHPILAIVEAVVSLRKNRPAHCPIPESKLNELLELLLIMEMAATKVDSFEESFLFNQAILENMPINSRVFLPARSNSHSITLDVRRETSNQYLVTIINSGEGIEATHRKSHGRYEYFVQYRLSSDQLRSANYFVNNKASTSSLYPSVGRITPWDATSLRISDTIKGQKSGTCYVKSTYLLIKWFLRELDPSNQTYYWWKVWHLRHRAQDIQKFWSSTEAKPISIVDAPANLRQPKEHSVASTILFLQTARLFLRVRQMPDQSIKHSCLEMLMNVPMVPEWKGFFEAFVKSHGPQ